ncbi:hypothetical protein DFH06DRAFT_1384915 [Mycena polygramma]|nr:hypothetical protein DFH06DRAFT_1384915 [Mycena polygramma]
MFFVLLLIELLRLPFTAAQMKTDIRMWPLTDNCNPGVQFITCSHKTAGSCCGSKGGQHGKIKGTHNAMRTGMLAAEAAFAALHPQAQFVSTAIQSRDSAQSDIVSLGAYRAALADLQRPLRRAQGATGVQHAARRARRRLECVDTILGGRVPWTLRHHAKTNDNPSTTSPDALATLPAASCTPIAYPPFEPPLSTDLMSSVALMGTNYANGETVHLRVRRGV